MGVSACVVYVCRATLLLKRPGVTAWLLCWLLTDQPCDLVHITVLLTFSLRRTSRSRDSK